MYDSPSSASLVLGIDTGGTYTDGVLLTYPGFEILAAEKTLTTPHDLSVCITQAIEALLPADPSRIKLIAISTTLATNAIAENKSRPVALFLLGYDPQMVERFDLARRFGTARYFYFAGGHDLYGVEQASPDLAGIVETAHRLQGQVDALAVSAYFSPLDASHENAALAALQQVSDLPVVLGHQLSTRLDSVKRATTATLNASLLSISQDFIHAVEGVMEQRGLHAPLLVVRGDGALMNTAAANARPVETIHSGPAASAIGGGFLSRRPRGLVIDIGGTTTDIAVIDGGRVNVLEEGTTVGNYHTAVRAAHVRSFGLGGDSQIAFDSAKMLQIGPGRVLPLAYLAHLYPQVGDEIRQTIAEAGVRPGGERPAVKRLEYWYLKRTPPRPPADEKARRAVELLAERPISLPELLKRLDGRAPHSFGGDLLLQQDIAGRAGLTPTDLLHATGEFDPWDTGIAALAVSTFAAVRGWSLEKFAKNVKECIAERIAAEVVAFLSGQTLKRASHVMNPDDLGLWLFEESIHPHDPYLGGKISLKMPIIGLGAPAHIYLPRVAAFLNTELILPPYHGVANAIGAVAGSIMVSLEAGLQPQGSGYVLQTENERKHFPGLEEAAAYGRSLLGQEALRQAAEMGAYDPQVEFEQTPTGLDSFRLTARAVGNPDLNGV